MSAFPFAPATGPARLLAGVGRPPTRTDHAHLYGPLPRVSDLVALAETAGLRGRGGAAFPTARKLAAVANASGRPVVVVNGAEAEPTSKKDRALLRIAPHLVLDGAVLVAQTVGAREILVGVSYAAPELQAAVRERSAREDRVNLDVRRVPSAFVAGEETALVRALAGAPAKPTLKPPYPTERGFRGRPTLVQNVETLAHVALLARYGAEWYGDGTALVTLGGAVAQPGVHEVPLRLTLDELFASCGGVTAELVAILVGGYFGRWIEPAAARSVLVTPQTIAAGAIVALPASTCAVSECTRVLRYLASQSAGQCGPCVHGLPALADAFGGRRRGEAARLAGLVERRGACRHPDGAARFAQSALDVFAEELAQHHRHRGCGRRDEKVLPTP